MKDENYYFCVKKVAFRDSFLTQYEKVVFAIYLFIKDFCWCPPLFG